MFSKFLRSPRLKYCQRARCAFINQKKVFDQRRSFFTEISSPKVVGFDGDHQSFKKLELMSRTLSSSDFIVYAVNCPKKFNRACKYLYADGVSAKVFPFLVEKVKNAADDMIYNISMMLSQTNKVKSIELITDDEGLKKRFKDNGKIKSIEYEGKTYYRFHIYQFSKTTKTSSKTTKAYISDDFETLRVYKNGRREISQAKEDIIIVNGIKKRKEFFLCVAKGQCSDKVLELINKGKFKEIDVHHITYSNKDDPSYNSSDNLWLLSNKEHQQLHKKRIKVWPLSNPNVVYYFNGYKEAAETLGLTIRGLGNVVNGRQKTTGKEKFCAAALV